MRKSITILCIERSDIYENTDFVDETKVPENNLSKRKSHRAPDIHSKLPFHRNTFTKNYKELVKTQSVEFLDFITQKSEKNLSVTPIFREFSTENTLPKTELQTPLPII